MATCPVDHKKGILPGAATMELPAGHPSTSAAAATANAATCPVPHGTAAAQPPRGSPSDTSLSSGGLPSQCPVNHGAAPSAGKRAARGTIYNVYAQPIDPTNQMPSTANQLPAPGQTMPLSVDRVQSTIPKGGTDSTWQYPSPQMFWNSLVRKGKTEDATEADIPTVVSIHNEMNERTWKQLMEWEDMHASDRLEGEPALRRFKGMPHTLSPKAQFKSWFGYGFPFDRHDWYVDRAGVERRYIIDYYFNSDPALAEAPAPLPGNSAGGTAPLTRSIYVDVRPAVDDVWAAIDRLRMLPGRLVDAMRRPKWKAEGLDPSKAPKEAAALSMLHSSNTLSDNAAPAVVAAAAPAAPELAFAAEFARVDTQCKPMLEALRSAASEEERRTAFVGLSYCTGSIVCPGEARLFMAAVEGGAPSGSEGGVEEEAFTAMNQCVVRKMAARKAQHQQRGEPPVANAVAGGGGVAAPAAQLK